MEIIASTLAADSPILRMPPQSAGVDRTALAAGAIVGVGGVEAAGLLGNLFGPTGEVLDKIAPHIPYVGPIYDLVGGAANLFGL